MPLIITLAAGVIIILARIEHSRRVTMSAITDAVTAIETQVQTLGTSVQTEIQQLKDAIASGADTTDAVTRLTAAGDALAGFKANLDADDPAAPPAG